VTEVTELRRLDGAYQCAFLKRNAFLYGELRLDERENTFKRAMHVFQKITNLSIPYGFLRLKRRQLFIALVLCIIIFRSLSLIHIYNTIIKYKSRNYLYNNAWLPCSLRKDPILYVVDTQKIMVAWETNCVLNNVRIQWYEKSIVNKINKSDIIESLKIDSSHHVYKGIIGPITSVGDFVYEIVQVTNQTTEIISSYSFQFFPSVPDNSNLTYPIQIVAFADNQFGLKVFNHLVQLASQRHSPNFIVHAGDSVQDHDNLHQWQTDFYDPLTNYNLAQHAPIIYARGNHDFDPKNLYVYTTDVPWYSLTIANTRWIVLDSNTDDMRQDLWLSRELSSPETQNSDFKIVVVHIPPFMEFWDPVAWHEKKEKYWGEFVRTRFVPLFRQHGIDLVISGHQHNYQRGQLNGTVYTIIGGAGGELDFNRVEDWSFYNIVRKTHHYILMEIWSDKIIWKAYNLRGSIIDKFELRKNSGQNSSVPT
jgi:predicted phosphodiesterase